MALQPVTNSDGQKGFYSESTGFIGLDSMQKVTNESGEKGYYHAKSGFVLAPLDGLPKTETQQPEKGFVDEVASDWRKRTGNVDKIIRSSDVLPSRVIQTVGQGGGMLVDLMSDASKAIYTGMIPEDVRGFISERNKAVVGGMPDAPPIRDGAVSLADAYKKVQDTFPEGMRNVEAVGNIAAAVPVAKGLSVAGEVAAKGMSGMTKAAVNKIAPKPSPEQAIGQVLQGKTADIAKGKKAFAAIEIDPSKINTYADLKKPFDTSITKMAKQVDDELLKDPTPRLLDDLSTIQKTKGGVDVKTNYVEKSLEHLVELYEKTGDAVKAGNVSELLDKAITRGLTKKEVNDIARVYGVEFKAFNPTSGVQLTSVNSQEYENVRKGLKEVARRGMGPEAKQLDDTLSGLLNTRRLVEKNIEAANRLRQKVDERGLGEKIGRAALTAMDIATFGTVKGAVLKMFPRGLGYKTKNYLDLEESLKRNLKIINDEYGRIP